MNLSPSYFPSPLDLLEKVPYYETKVWLISVLMITNQDLELMILFQV